MDLRGASKPKLPARSHSSLESAQPRFFPKGARVIARTNTSWCKCGEIGLIVGLEMTARTESPEYWVIFEDGGFSLWPHHLLEETLAVTTYIDAAARDAITASEESVQNLRITGSFRF